MCRGHFVDSNVSLRSKAIMLMLCFRGDVLELAYAHTVATDRQFSIQPMYESILNVANTVKRVGEGTFLF